MKGMKTKEILIKAETSEELAARLKEQKEKGGWEPQAIFLDSPGVFSVMLWKQ